MIFHQRKYIVMAKRQTCISVTASRAMGNRTTNKLFSFFSTEIKNTAQNVLMFCTLCMGIFILSVIILYVPQVIHTQWEIILVVGKSTRPCLSCMPMSSSSTMYILSKLPHYISELNFSRYSILILYMARKIFKFLLLRIFLRNIKEIEMRALFKGFHQCLCSCLSLSLIH